MISRRWKVLGWCGAVIAAAGICLSPVVARQVSAQLQPEQVVLTEQENRKLMADKEVVLTADGGFRMAVLTIEGQPVAGAQVILTGQVRGREQARKLMTGKEGQVLAQTMKPGLYGVQIEAEQGAYEGTLRVWQAGQAPGTVAEVVAFTLSKDKLVRGQEENEDDELRGAAWWSDGGRWAAYGLGAAVVGGLVFAIAGSDGDDDDGGYVGEGFPSD